MRTQIEIEIEELIAYFQPIVQFHCGKYNNFKHGSALKNDKKSLSEGVAKIKALLEHLDRLIEIENINDIVE